MYEFNEKSFVDCGTMISKNFIIEHLSSGAWHPSLGRIIPTFPQIIDPTFLRNVPLWKLARNLAGAAEAAIEPLLQELGADLIIQAGFNRDLMGTFTKEIGHKAGLSLDIQVRGFEDNMYYIAKDIQKIAKRSSSIDLIQDISSWMHLNIDLRKVNESWNNAELPNVTSFDLINNVKETGIQRYRA